MFTPRILLIFLRFGAVLCGLALMVLWLGPFARLEALLGLGGVQAHAMIYFCITLTMFAIAPRRRRVELATGTLALGLAIEMAQGVTGRGLSAQECAATAAGVGAALFPYCVEGLRRWARTHPDVDFRTLRSLDRTAPQGRRRRSGETIIEATTSYRRIA